MGTFMYLYFCFYSSYISISIRMEIKILTILDSQVIYAVNFQNLNSQG